MWKDILAVCSGRFFLAFAEPSAIYFAWANVE